MQKIEVYTNVLNDEHNRVLLLTINDYAQLDSLTEPIYHETAIHGGISVLGNIPKKSLILGGGDGCAARELLKYKDNKIALVDIDAYMLYLAKNNENLVQLNRNALNNERCKVYNEDAKKWIKRCRKNKYDFIFADFPDPSNPVLASLFCLSFYTECLRILRPDGVFVIQASGLGMDKLHKFIINQLLRAGFASAIPMKAEGVLGGVQMFFVAHAIKNKKEPYLDKNIETKFWDSNAMKSAFAFSKYWKERIKKADINGITDAFVAWAEDNIQHKILKGDFDND